MGRRVDELLGKTRGERLATIAVIAAFSAITLSSMTGVVFCFVNEEPIGVVFFGFYSFVFGGSLIGAFTR